MSTDSQVMHIKMILLVLGTLPPRLPLPKFHVKGSGACTIHTIMGNGVDREGGGREGRGIGNNNTHTHISSARARTLIVTHYKESVQMSATGTTRLADENKIMDQE